MSDQHQTGCNCSRCRGYDAHDVAAQRGGEQGFSADELRTFADRARARQVLDRMEALLLDLGRSPETRAIVEQFLADLKGMP